MLAEGGDRAATVRGAYLRVLNPPPTAEQVRVAAAFLEAFGHGADPAAAAAALTQTLLASAEFLYLY